MQKNRIDEIALIKTAMIVIIVFYHSCLFFSKTWFTYVSPVYSADYLNGFTTWLNTFQIQALIMASGYIFYYSQIELNKYKSFKKDMLKKAKRLLLPYLFVSIFWVIPITMMFEDYTYMDIIRKFILCISPAQLWYLIMIFGVFAIFELIGKKIKITPSNLILIYLVSTLLFCIFGFYNIDYFQIPKIFKNTLFFFLGGFLYKYNKNITKKEIIFLIVSFILLMPLKMLLNDSTNIMKTITIFVEQALSMVEVMLIYISFKKLLTRNKVINNTSIYKCMEKNSFGIYLFHQQIIYFCIILLNGIVPPCIQIIITFIISVTIPMCITIILRKNKTTKTMFGLE